MGAVYTNTDNAIKVTGLISGNDGPQGYPGKNGATGNAAVWSDQDPTTAFTQVGLISGRLIPYDKDGNRIPTANTTDPYTVQPTWPNLGDLWIRSNNGDVYTCQEQGNVRSFAYSHNIRGAKGSDNFLKTEVSFNGEDTTLGYPIGYSTDRQLVGHFIFPGKDVCGSINNIRVLINANTDGAEIRGDIFLVNMGETDLNVDDIVVGSTLNTSITGRGDNKSWQIIELTIDNNAVPRGETIFGLFVDIRAPRYKEQEQIKDIEASYGSNFSALLAEILRQREDRSTESFYKVMEKEGFVTPENPIKYTERLAEDRKTVERIDAMEAELVKQLEKERDEENAEGKVTRPDDIYKPWIPAPVLTQVDIKIAHITIS